MFRHIQLFILVFGITQASQAKEIPLNTMSQQLPPGTQIQIESLMPGQIAEVQVDQITMKGPFKYTEQIHTDQDVILLFLEGSGKLKSMGDQKKVSPESIALVFAGSEYSLNVPRRATLRFVRIRKTLSKQDLIDMETFPPENRARLYYKTFLDCEAYTEPIKSPNTVSRTVLPKDFIPRVALGTVTAPGPDAVGAHEHGMLEQFFLGLSDNNVTVFADGMEQAFGATDILHIPRGSSHGVKVGENMMMNYMWMDFFQTKEGQVWLKTHKKIEGNDYKE